MTDEQLQKYVVGRESSKTLKEIGFNEQCVGYWDMDEDFYKFVYYQMERNNEENPERESTAPLLDQAFEWFSDRFIFGSTFKEGLGSDEWGFSYSIQYLLKENQSDKRRASKFKGIGSYSEGGGTYSGAWNTELEAKQECIKRMIEIFKDNQ